MPITMEMNMKNTSLKKTKLNKNTMANNVYKK